MSITDPEAESTQPEGEGQGGEATGGSPWESYLTRFPEDVRDVASEAFREMEGNATRRFQESSEYRKTWEPYEALGVSKLQPDEVQWALDFRQAAVENPTAVKEWFDQYAQQHNLIEQPPAEQTPSFDEFQDPSQQLEALLKQQLTPLQQQIEQVVQWRQEQEFEQRKAEADRFIEGQLSDLKAKHPDAFKDSGEYGAEKMIERLIAPYIESDPNNAVTRAFGDYQAWLGHVEKQTLQSKVDAPAPAESGGVPDVSPDKLSTFKQAEAAAVEFLRNSHRA